MSIAKTVDYVIYRLYESVWHFAYIHDLVGLMYYSCIVFLSIPQFERVR